MKPARSPNETTGEEDRVDVTAISPEPVLRGRVATAASILHFGLGSHADALRSVLIVVAVVVVSLFLGYLTGAGVVSPLLTTPLFCLVLFGAFSWATRRPASSSELEDPTRGGSPTSRRML